MIKVIKNLLIIMSCFAISACSFQSAQYQLIKSLLVDEDEGIALNELAWTLSWQDKSYELLPFISEDLTETYFMDNETIKVSFDGWQIFSVEGLLPTEEEVRIIKTDAGLQYFLGSDLISYHVCTDFVSSINNGMTIWKQNCGAEKGDYVNEIQVNQAGAIVLLNFKIHPAYSMIKLVPVTLAMNNPSQ